MNPASSADEPTDSPLVSKREIRKATKQENRERYRAAAARFPHAWLHADSSSPQGVPIHITLGCTPGENGLSIMVTQKRDPTNFIVSTTLDLEVGDTARFIHALMCRYNALVEETNATIASVQSKQLIKSADL